MNYKFLFFDTETTGFFEYGTPLVFETLWEFPRMVQLAWQLRRGDGSALASCSSIVKPEGFTIPAAAEAIHGISTERAIAEGEELYLILETFADAIAAADFIVAHNFDFDAPIVGAELLRLGYENYLPTCPAYCTQKQPTDWAKIPYQLGKRGNENYKWPSLAELHRLCGFGEIANAHDALSDVEATQKCFFHILNAAPEVFSNPYSK